MTDDLDPNVSADETVRFSIDNREMEIDLSSEHASELREALAPYINAARKASGGSARGGRRSSGGNTASRDETSRIRLWALDQGLKVSERGRIPQNILDEFRKHHAA
jgi:hypothetical protein